MPYAYDNGVALWYDSSGTGELLKDAMELIARDDYMVCSDITPAGTMPHPRSYGAFPRFLGRLRRAYPTVTLEGMVHRMTDRPARRFNLTKRGRL